MRIILQLIIILVSILLSIITHSCNGVNSKEMDIKLKNTYELVKRDININRLGVPAKIEFPNFDEINCAKSTEGKAIITFWVKHKDAEIFNIDSTRFVYSIDTNGRYQFISDK